jgi:uncharacterized membrane protein
MVSVLVSAAYVKILKSEGISKRENLKSAYCYGHLNIYTVRDEKRRNAKTLRPYEFLHSTGLGIWILPERIYEFILEALMAKRFTKATLHWLFKISIVFKGLDGLTELVGGFLFVFFSPDAISDFVEHITRSVLQYDPDNWIASSLRHAFDHLSTGNKILVAIYLLGHGAIKLLIVVGLLREKRWVFPMTCVLLLAFVGFLIYRMCVHFSIGLMIFTVLDAFIVALVWNEYRSFKKNPPAP